jgi:hypothetical protein
VNSFAASSAPEWKELYEGLMPLVSLGKVVVLTAGTPVPLLPTLFQRLAIDNFTRANENPLSQNGAWTKIVPWGAEQVVSNSCQGTINGNCGAVYTGAKFPNDQYCELTIGATFGVGAVLGLLVRCTAGGNCYGYFVTGPAGSANNVYANYVLNGTGFALGSAFTLTPHIGDVFRLLVMGVSPATLYFYQNGTLVDVRSDSTANLASGIPGINVEGGAGGNANSQASLFAAGGTPVSVNANKVYFTTLSGQVGQQMYVLKAGAVYNQLAADTFTRANENPLNPALWTTLVSGTTTPLQVVSNLCEGTNVASGLNMEIYTGVSWPSDQYAEVIVNTAIDASNALGPICRGVLGVQTFYYFQIGGPLGASATVKMFKVVSGATTQLGSTVTMTINSGAVARLEVQGTSLVGKVNGVGVITVTDSSIASGTPGLWIQCAVALGNSIAGAWDAGSISGSTILKVGQELKVLQKPTGGQSDSWVLQGRGQALIDLSTIYIDADTSGDGILVSALI